MKKLIIACSIMITANTFALNFEKVDVNHLNFNFDGTSGVANLTAGHYETSKFSFSTGNSEALVAKEGNLFNVQYHNLDFHLNLESGGLLDSLGTVDVQNLSIELIPNKKLAVYVDKFSAEIGEGVQDFNHVEIECAQRSRSSLYTDYLLPCLSLGRIKLPLLNLDSKSSMTVAKAIETEDVQGTLGILKNLKNIRVNIIENRYMITFVAKFIINLKANASGAANFNQETNELTLSLEKAKAGIFSIRSKVLKEISKANIKNVRVEGRNIIIKL